MFNADLQPHELFQIERECSDFEKLSEVDKNQIFRQVVLLAHQRQNIIKQLISNQIKHGILHH